MFQASGILATLTTFYMHCFNAQRICAAKRLCIQLDKLDRHDVRSSSIGNLVNP